MDEITCNLIIEQLKNATSAIEKISLADAYNKKDNTNPDKIKLYNEALDSNELTTEQKATAQYNLAYWYSQGLGCGVTVENIIKALILYSESATESPYAINNLQRAIFSVMHMTVAVEIFVHVINSCTNGIEQFMLQLYLSKIPNVFVKRYGPTESIFKVIHTADSQCLIKHENAIVNCKDAFDTYEDRFKSIQLILAYKAAILKLN